MPVANDADQLRDYVDKLLAQNRTLSAQKLELERQIREIISSKSWQITAPLRGLVKFLRLIRPLWRSSNIVLKSEVAAALTRVSVNGRSLFQVSGTSPSLALQSVDGRMPTGWCLVRTRLQSTQSHMAAFLYFQTGEGFTADQRVLLESENGKTVEKLLKLPSSVRALKVDPFDMKKPFCYDQFEIRELGSVQVFSYLFRRHVLSQFSNPRMLFCRARKALALVREGGLIALRVRLFADDITNNYQEWVRRFDTIGADDRERIKSFLSSQTYQPRISIVMPTYNTPERWLRAAIESVTRQLYQNWELCIADDASSDARIVEILAEYAKADARIKFTVRGQNGHIAAASNSALELATGEFVALLDHDDELTEDALAHVVARLNINRDLDLIYSDEDKKTAHDMRFNPHFKSDWNPELLLSQNYICHFSVFRAEIVRAVGGFRIGTEGAQDWDLIWRVADATTPARIAHIPHILYHWRVIEGSTAQSTDFKPYVLDAQVKAVSDHLQRRGVIGASVEILRDISQLRVHFPVPEPQPFVTLIIPTKDMVEILDVCVSSILKKTRYKNFEIIIVDNNSVDAATLDYFTRISRDARIRVIQDRKPFNFSRINNQAVLEARGSLIGFLNNDLEVINEDWLDELVSHAVRPEVGAVGAQLWYPSDLLQHGGIILGIGGVAGHNHKGRRRGDPGYFNRIILPQNLSAVTAACLVMRRSIFDEIKGFNEIDFSVAFNDVDLCLRIRKAGYQIIYDPFAQLYHHESASRGYENTPEKFMRFEGEIEKMKDMWKDALKVDPYYNPNLTLISEDFSFAFPPRQAKPWN